MKIMRTPAATTLPAIASCMSPSSATPYNRQPTTDDAAVQVGGFKFVTCARARARHGS